MAPSPNPHPQTRPSTMSLTTTYYAHSSHRSQESRLRYGTSAAWNSHSSDPATSRPIDLRVWWQAGTEMHTASGKSTRIGAKRGGEKGKKRGDVEIMRTPTVIRSTRHSPRAASNKLKHPFTPPSSTISDAPSRVAPNIRFPDYRDNVPSLANHRNIPSPPMQTGSRSTRVLFRFLGSSPLRPHHAFWQLP